MKVLLITNLFPNNKEPNRGIFVKQSAVNLAKLCELVVVAPVNWFPPFLKWPKGMAALREVKREETIEGVRVLHPRWFSVPLLTRLLNGFFMFAGLFPCLVRLKQQFACDIIYAQWLFPDGFAAVLLAKLLNKPIVLHAHGCDLNLYTRFYFRRKMIMWALKNAHRVIVVSAPMKERSIALGIPGEKMSIIPNGINKDLFKPLDQKKCRVDLNISFVGKIILFIGSFEEVKGIHFLLPAFRDVLKSTSLPVRLIMIGKGAWRVRIEQLISELKIDHAVEIVGEVSHDSIAKWINAADILCLPSIREGLPNVVLEAQACGKPVVASDVGGISDVISSDRYGFLSAAGDCASLSVLLNTALNITWNENVIAQNPRLISWRENALHTYELFMRKQ